jgi:hypothetical protein
MGVPGPCAADRPGAGAGAGQRPRSRATPREDGSTCRHRHAVAGGVRPHFFITQGPGLGFRAPWHRHPGRLTVALSFAVLPVAERSTRIRCSISRSSASALLGRDHRLHRHELQLLAVHDLPADLLPGGLGYDAVTAGSALLAYTLPTLVLPPLAERLSLRYRPGVVIPAGLFVIGLGFMLMYASAAAWRRPAG